MKTRFLSINKSTFLGDVTSHNWTYRSQKRDYWEEANRPLAGRHYPHLNDSQPENVIPDHQQTTPLQKTLPISESFPACIRDSWASGNQTHCCTELPISECFAAWILDSWSSANLPYCCTSQTIFENFASWKRDSWASANRPSCRMHCSYLKVSQPENAILNNQPIDPLAIQDIERCAVWKLNSWTRANRKPYRTPLTIYEWFIAWKRDSRALEIEPHCWTALQDIDPLVGPHCQYMNVMQLENAISEK